MNELHLLKPRMIPFNKIAVLFGKQQLKTGTYKSQIHLYAAFQALWDIKQPIAITSDIW